MTGAFINLFINASHCSPANQFPMQQSIYISLLYFPLLHEFLNIISWRNQIVSNTRQFGGCKPKESHFRRKSYVVRKNQLTDGVTMKGSPLPILISLLLVGLVWTTWAGQPNPWPSQTFLGSLGFASVMLLVQTWGSCCATEGKGKFTPNCMAVTSYPALYMAGLLACLCQCRTGSGCPGVLELYRIVISQSIQSSEAPL